MFLRIRPEAWISNLIPVYGSKFYSPSVHPMANRPVLRAMGEVSLRSKASGPEQRQHGRSGGRGGGTARVEGRKLGARGALQARAPRAPSLRRAPLTQRSEVKRGLNL